MKKLIIYIVFLFLITVFQNPVKGQNERIDSLKFLLKTDRADTNKAIHLYRLCKEHFLTGEYEAGISYGKQGLNLAQQLNFKSGMADSYNHLGNIYWKQARYPEALDMHEKALAIRKEIKDQSGIASSYNNMGNVFMDMGNYGRAISNHFSALKIREQMQYKFGIATSRNNIGIIYLYQGKFPEALENFNIALKIQEELGNKYEMASAYNNIGNLYDDMGDYQTALQNHLAALELRKETGDQRGVAGSYNNIGNAWHSLGNYPEAMKNYTTALKLQEEAGYEEAIARSCTNLGRLYFNMKNNPEALRFLKRSLAMNKKLGYKEGIKIDYESLANVDSSMGNYKAAFEHKKLYYLYRDSLVNEEANRKIVQSSMQYEFDKKEAATKAESDKVVLQLEADKKLDELQRIFLVIFILIMVVLLYFAKRAYDNKKKVAEFMGAESKRKEVLLQEVHHRINNNLQIISSLLTLQANSAGDQRLSEYLMQSQNRIQSLSVLHELLYQNNSSLKVKMDAYLKEVLGFHRDVLSTQSASAVIETDIEDISFSTKLAVPIALIVNEIVTNSIKYAFDKNASGKILVSLKLLEANKWLLHVSDTGKGLPSETGFRKDSLGLRLVAIMSKQIGGILTRSNSPGATFEVVFSVKE
ncbi:MAG: hypothetical protein K0S33_1897 [Bacteroidetes bacterium]|nr:hypothetical protein [Bacteroidota bacterium]